MIKMPRIQIIKKKHKKKIYPQYFLTIPLEIIKQKNWKEGDEIEFKVYKGGLIYLAKKE